MSIKPRRNDLSEFDNLTATEALYAFTSWLSTRAQPVTMSKAHDFGVVARLVEDFVVANRLAPVRKDWGKRDYVAPSRCRVCGCTDSKACVDESKRLRCCWVEPDLCSACDKRPKIGMAS